MTINKDNSTESEQSLTQNEQSQFFNSLLKVGNNEILSAEEESNMDNCLQKLDLVKIDPSYKTYLDNRFSKDKSSSNWSMVNKPSFFWGIILGILITTFSTGILGILEGFLDIPKYEGITEAFFSWFFYLMCISLVSLPLLILFYTYCVGKIKTSTKFVWSAILFLLFQMFIDDGKSMGGLMPPIYTFIISFLITITYFIILHYLELYSTKKRTS